MSRTYFLTGGAGNLACQLTFDLRAQGHRVVLFDHAPRPVAAVAAGCEYLCGDLTDADSVSAALEQSRPAVIMHFASLLSGSCELQRNTAWRVNMDGTFILFESALLYGVQQIFVPSSLATYGGELPNPLGEDFPQWPTGLYGVTKVAIERLSAYYHHQHGLDVRCLRLPVVISPFAPFDAVSAYASRAFVEAVQSCRFTWPVNPGTRPAMIYVKDVLQAMTSLLEVPSSKLTRRVYNIDALAPTAQELTDAIQARVPSACLDFKPDPQVVALIESWPIEIDDATARHDWGWRPRYDLAALADDFIFQLRADL